MLLLVIAVVLAVVVLDVVHAGEDFENAEWTLVKGPCYLLVAFVNKIHSFIINSVNRHFGAAGIS